LPDPLQQGQAKKTRTTADFNLGEVLTPTIFF